MKLFDGGVIIVVLVACAIVAMFAASQITR